jgi:hypothetical protein
MLTRPASFCLVVAFVCAIGSGSVHAQGPGGPPSGGAIQTLINQVAALQARVTALESDNASLATRVTALETIDLSDIVGTYHMATLGIEMNGGSPDRIKTSTDTATITLNADGTGVYAGRHVSCSLTGGVAGCQPAQEPGPGPFTWTYANGVVTIGDQPGDQLILTVTHSGTMIIGDASEFQPGNTWAVIFVFVKVP